MAVRFYLTMLLAIVLLQTGCADKPQVAETATPPSPAEPSLAQSSNEDSSEEAPPIIIDVRSKEEWDEGHLEQAIFVPHEEIEEKIAEVTDDKSAKLVLY